MKIIQLNRTSISEFSITNASCRIGRKLKKKIARKAEKQIREREEKSRSAASSSLYYDEPGALPGTLQRFPAFFNLLSSFDVVVVLSMRDDGDFSFAYFTGAGEQGNSETVPDTECVLEARGKFRPPSPLLFLLEPTDLDSVASIQE